MLHLEGSDRLDLRGAPRPRRLLLGEADRPRAEHFEVFVAGALRRRTTGGELPDGLQHPVAGRVALDETAFDEGSDVFDRSVDANDFDGIERATANEAADPQQ